MPVWMSPGTYVCTRKMLATNVIGSVIIPVPTRCHDERLLGVADEHRLQDEVRDQKDHEVARHDAQHAMHDEAADIRLVVPSGEQAPQDRQVQQESRQREEEDECLTEDLQLARLRGVHGVMARDVHHENADAGDAAGAVQPADAFVPTCARRRERRGRGPVDRDTGGDAPDPLVRHRLCSLR